LDFSPAEAVYGTQPVLPGQYLATNESPSPSFLADLQGLLTSRTVIPTSHHNTPAPMQLPKNLLLARHVIIRKDGHVPPLAAIYDGPYLVLERSLRTFKLQIGNKQENVSTFRLKACVSPPDVQVAQPQNGDVRPTPPQWRPTSILHPQPLHLFRCSELSADASPKDVPSLWRICRLLHHSIYTLLAALHALLDRRSGTYSASSSSGALSLGGEL
jgi:hypothetical protein